MKYFIITMFVLWMGLTLILAIKETYYENNTDNHG
jgi:preprotein translocase subunit SecG